MSPRPNPTLPRTPLREWRQTSGITYGELALLCRCALRTVLRVAAGNPATPRVAIALAQHTGIPATVFTGVYVAETRALHAEKAARLAQLVEALEDLNATRSALLRSVVKEAG